MAGAYAKSEAKSNKNGRLEEDRGLAARRHTLHTDRS